VLVLADETAEPAFVAIDLLAQAEHDPRAAAFLVTTDPTLPDEVEGAIELLLADAPRADIMRRSLKDNGLIIIVPDAASALDVANEIAPEHLEVMMDEPSSCSGDPQRGRHLRRAVDAGERG